ncbi:MAG TPA: hypothetical protein DDZ51_16825 [Planctomycetaceae bacterium]|nr:hypothetical protein [Planctomycetaceae bacterium]
MDLRIDLKQEGNRKLCASVQQFAVFVNPYWIAQPNLFYGHNHLIEVVLIYHRRDITLTPDTFDLWKRGQHIGHVGHVVLRRIWRWLDIGLRRSLRGRDNRGITNDTGSGLFWRQTLLSWFVSSRR